MSPAGLGFIGSHIVEGLAGQKHEVVILDNLFSGKMENIAPFLEKDNVSFANGSITDLPLLRKTFEGADGIFHEGAIASVPYSVTHPAESHEVNLTGTLNVLAAARDCGVKNVVFASSAAVYGDRPELPKREDMIPETLSPYAVTKWPGNIIVRCSRGCMESGALPCGTSMSSGHGRIRLPLTRELSQNLLPTL